MLAMNIIEIRNLSHRTADGKRILTHIDLEVKAGEFIVLAGANGSGKTSLLRHLNGLLFPSEGSVTIDGVPVLEDLKRARKRVGMIFQDADSQIVGETVFDDAAFGPENLGLDQDEVHERVNRTLDTVGLSHLKDQRPHLLSGGEKRRLAVAGILTMAPKVVVFDEPFSNLDYPGTRQVLAQMAALKQSGHTMMVATHNLETVVGLADRLILMQGGKIIKDGPFEKVVRSVEEFGVRMPGAVFQNGEVQSWLNP
jgi:biotin transport system ATP-binding protein